MIQFAQHQSLPADHPLADLGKVTLLDVRTAAEVEGVDLKGNPKGGTIPGALSVPHARFLQQDAAGCPMPVLQSAEAIRSILAEAGVPEPAQAGRVVCFCQSGMRAALGALALNAAGYHVAVYDASMAGYSRHPDAVLATPEN